ncbi:MAG: type I glyceraldehyde-3-phosphate dehydrogenase [Alphaproteobacteria bacterium]|nr:type I glyceraldehyde-3-phosphate dehydrogenase [Alphaproteobacteria bacterium]
MTIRVAINGLGRIGRCVTRAIFEDARYSNVELVAVNGPAPITTHVHLLKYDSIHGRFSKSVEGAESALIIDGKRVQLFGERDPRKLPWGDLKIDVVLECTGAFTKYDDAAQHITAGAKRVIISAPAKEDSVKTIIYGVNDEILKAEDKVISVGSCTTNCLAPIAKALNDAIGIEKGFMTTIHAYTNDQNVVDNSHKDLRRARACAMSMIPTSTGAAKAIGLVLPELKGKLDGGAIRVPTANVSMVDLNFLAKRETTKEEVNEVVEKAAAGRMRNILQIVTEPLVSIDFNHSPYSSCFDTTQTKVLGGNMVKVASWYDNEWAFSLRMLDIASLNKS